MENTFLGLEYSKDEVNVPWSVFLGSRLSHDPLLLYGMVLSSWLVIFQVQDLPYFQTFSLRLRVFFLTFAAILKNNY